MTEEGSLSEAIEEDLAVEDEDEYFRIDALTSSGSPVLINSVKTWNVSKLDKKRFCVVFGKIFRTNFRNIKGFIKLHIAFHLFILAHLLLQSKL